MKSTAERELAEIRFWENSKSESPQSDSLESILRKAAEAQVFLEKVDYFKKLFVSANRILELGGGQCWASCIVKRLFSNVHVTATDISPAAVASLHKWEHIFRVKVDDVEACSASDTPFGDKSFDLVFVFSAAHHFAQHRKTFIELARILRPGGTALYLHEPGCQSFMLSAARWRVNAKRPWVYEDVIVYKKLMELGKETGLDVKVRFAPTITNRGPMQTIYFFVMRQLPLLQYVLPTTVDIIIHKPA